MAQYIDKDAVLAIIEQLKDEAIDMEDKARWFLSAALARRINTLEVKEMDLEKSIDVDSMVTEYLKQYEEAGQTPFAMNIIGSAYRKGLEDMFKLKSQKEENV